MKNAKAIVLMSDFWTYLGNVSYCGIIRHWIADDWNLISVGLECVHVAENHNCTNIYELYKQIAKDWDITNKIKILATDKAQNMISVVNQTGFGDIQC